MALRAWWWMDGAGSAASTKAKQGGNAPPPEGRRSVGEWEQGRCGQRVGAEGHWAIQSA